MDFDCSSFAGGYCPRVKMHIMTTYCRNKCRANMPGAIRLAGNFAKAVIKHATSGGTARTDDEQAKCLSICQTNVCGKYRTINGHERCSHSKCGCYLSRKIAWASEHCPDSRW